MKALTSTAINRAVGVTAAWAIGSAGILAAGAAGTAIPTTLATIGITLAEIGAAAVATAAGGATVAGGTVAGIVAPYITPVILVGGAVIVGLAGLSAIAVLTGLDQKSGLVTVPIPSNNAYKITVSKKPPHKKRKHTGGPFYHDVYIYIKKNPEFEGPVRERPKA